MEAMSFRSLSMNLSLDSLFELTTKTLIVHPTDIGLKSKQLEATPRHFFQCLITSFQLPYAQTYTANGLETDNFREIGPLVHSSYARIGSRHCFVTHFKNRLWSAVSDIFGKARRFRSYVASGSSFKESAMSRISRTFSLGNIVGGCC